MCCGKTCLKICNLFFTTLFSVISLTEILSGTYMLVYMYKIYRPETLGNQYITIPALSLTLFGIILLSLIVLGYCGLCKEVACCVNLYSSVLLVLSVLQILVGIFAIVTFVRTNTSLSSQIKEDFTYSFRHYQLDPKLVNTIQREMPCCGPNSPLDWKLGNLPHSCCGDNEASCHLNSDYLFDKGCVDQLTQHVLLWNSVIGYSLVAIGIIEVVVAVLGFSLGCGSFRNYYKV